MSAVEAEDLWRAVRRLSGQDQDVVLLRFFMEMSERETAAVLEVAVGTVKSRTHRALARLRTLTEHGFAGLTDEARA